jgi:hypothetical protein
MSASGSKADTKTGPPLSDGPVPRLKSVCYAVAGRVPSVTETVVA